MAEALGGGEKAVTVVLTAAGTIASLELSPLGDVVRESWTWEAGNGGQVSQIQGDVDELKAAQTASDNEATKNAIKAEVDAKQNKLTLLKTDKPEHTGNLVESSAILGCLAIGYVGAIGLRKVGKGLASKIPTK